jgi:predicted transposase YbfD/YdcC
VLTRQPTPAPQTAIVALVTTLPPAPTTPSHLLELVRGHWPIEHGWHQVHEVTFGEVTFGEDRSRLRPGNAPQILAGRRGASSPSP